MIDYVSIFFLLASMQYPTDDHINLFDHTKYDIFIAPDSATYHISPIGPMAQEAIKERLLLQIELEVLDELIAQDSLDALNDPTVKYYPEDSK